jgi:hypothetical protein
MTLDVEHIVSPVTVPTVLGDAIIPVGYMEHTLVITDHYRSSPASDVEALGGC